MTNIMIWLLCFNAFFFGVLALLWNKSSMLNFVIKTILIALTIANIMPLLLNIMELITNG